MEEEAVTESSVITRLNEILGCPSTGTHSEEDSNQVKYRKREI